MAEVNVTRELILAVMGSDPVRAALRARADEIETRAEGIAQSEEVEANFSVDEGTRPKGRPYARVLCDNVEQEYGTAKTERRRILGRAGGV